MEKNYYEEKIEEINELITKKEFKEAFSLLKEELAISYIPSIYEKQFDKLLEDIKPELIEKNTGHGVSSEVALEFLTSNDEKQEAIALEVLRDHNLRNHIDLLKERIESWPTNKTIMKAFLFELLIEQEIDVEINFNGLKLNPKNGSILNHEEVQKAMNEIPKQFDKDVAASNMALDEFQRFLLITYPAVPEDGKSMAIDISKIIKSFFDNKVLLNERQTKIKQILSK